MCAAKQCQADIVLFDLDAVDENGNLMFTDPARLDPNLVLTLDTCPTLLNVSPSACNKLFRKAFLNEKGLHFPESRFYEDLSTTPALYDGARTVYINESLYYYVN